MQAHADVKTTDGYMLRLFCISFTKKRQGQVAKCCYAQVRRYDFIVIAALPCVTCLTCRPDMHDCCEDVYQTY